MFEPFVDVGTKRSTLHKSDDRIDQEERWQILRFDRWNLRKVIVVLTPSENMSAALFFGQALNTFANRSDEWNKLFHFSFSLSLCLSHWFVYYSNKINKRCVSFSLSLRYFRSKTFSIHLPWNCLRTKDKHRKKTLSNISSRSSMTDERRGSNLYVLSEERRNGMRPFNFAENSLKRRPKREKDRVETRARVLLFSKIKTKENWIFAA